MSDPAAKDKEFHARIATVYDYLTNEPRAYPNELLFCPLDRWLRPVNLMLDLGCATGQMIGRYGGKALRIIGVDHSGPMLHQADLKYRARFGQRLELIEADVAGYLDEYCAPPGTGDLCRTASPPATCATAGDA